MTVLLLLLIFTLLGFLLAQSAWGDTLTDWLVALPGKIGVKPGEDALTSPIKQEQLIDKQSLTKWVSSSANLPDDFRVWYLSLPEGETTKFDRALQVHASSTGLNISKLISGGLDQQADVRKVYVEAVSVYSQAYRKAREAIEQDAEAKETESNVIGDETKTTVEGKTVAEKRESRRRRSPNTQNEPAPAA